MSIYFLGYAFSSYADRLAITNQALRELSGVNGLLIGDWIKSHADEIISHNSKYGMQNAKDPTKVETYYNKRHGLGGSNRIDGWIASLFVLALPLVGVIGAGIVRNKPLTGSGLMAAIGIVFISVIFSGRIFGASSPGVPGLPMVVSLGFPTQIFLMPSAALFLVGAILGVIGKFLS